MSATYDLQSDSLPYLFSVQTNTILFLKSIQFPRFTTHLNIMRPVAVVCAIAAGAAARLVMSRFCQFRHDQREPTAPVAPQIETTVSVPQQNPDKQPVHPQVLALLDSVAPVMRGVSYVHKHSNDRDCTFCLEPITSSSAYVRVTPCRHVFHAECLEQWVMFTANAALDWRNYVVNDDGMVDVAASPPTCPNCTTRLPVLPAPLVRHALLTAVTHKLSLPNLAVAATMYDAGLVSRAPPLTVQHPQARPVATPLVRSTTSLASESPTTLASLTTAPAAMTTTPANMHQQQFSHASPSTSTLPSVVHVPRQPAMSRLNFDPAVSSSSSIALVTPPNVRMLERNAWRAPVARIDPSDRHASAT